MSTIIRAMSRDGVAIARGATATSIAWSAMNRSTRSNAPRGTPSISTIAPSRTTMPGAGSFGLEVVARPTSGHGVMNVSLLIGRSANRSNRFDRIAASPVHECARRTARPIVRPGRARKPYRAMMLA